MIVEGESYGVRPVCGPDGMPRHTNAQKGHPGAKRLDAKPGRAGALHGKGALLVCGPVLAGPGGCAVGLVSRGGKNRPAW